MEEKETIVIDIQLDAKGVADQLAQVNQNIASVKAQNASLRKEVKDGTKTWRDVSEQLAVNEQRLKTLTTTQKVLTSQYNAQVGTNKRLGDSLKEMGSELTALKNEYRSLSAAERESAKGQDLLKHIQDLDTAMKEADYTMGDHQRNVGNYPDAVKPVTAQLREMTQELIRLRVEGKANTEEYDELLKKVGEMKDAMADAQSEVKQMASDTSTLNSVLDAAKLATGAFSAALGIFNIIGDKDSKTAQQLAEAQKKLQAAIAVTTGLQAVQNALQKESALMMGIHKIQVWAAAKAQDEYAAATGRATIAQRVFNTVAKANPYVLLAGVILTVVGAIAAFTAGSKEQEKQTEEVNEKLRTQISLLKQLNEQYQSLRSVATDEIDYQIQMAEATGANAKTIEDLKIAKLDYLQKALDADEALAESARLQYTAVNDAYQDNLSQMKQWIVNRAVLLAQGDKDGAEWVQNDIDRLQQVMDRQKELLDFVDALDARQRAIDLERERIANSTLRTVTNNIKTLKRETQELIDIATSEELYSKIEDRSRRLAESIQKVADRIGLLKGQLQSLEYAMPDPNIQPIKVDDSNVPQPSAFEMFSASFIENAEAIMETSSALESSFGSLSSMYETMAKDESKSEEERADAARKAKAWAKVQIATNAATAVAKGVASAVDVGFPAAIPAIATMLAAVLSAIAQAKALASEAGSFEHGGVIGGYRGATMGKDNTFASVRTGEMIITADQQRRLFDIANGSATTNLTASLVEALQAMPAPVMVYSEFRRFTDRVATLDDAAKLH